MQVTDIDSWVKALLKANATHVIGNRPDRVKPRVVNRMSQKLQIDDRTQRRVAQVLANNGNMNSPSAIRSWPFSPTANQ